MLVALHEEQNQAGESLKASDTDELVDGLSRKLENQFEKRFDSLKDHIANSDSNCDDNGDASVDSATLRSILKRFKAILKRFDSLESKLGEFEKNMTGDADGPQFSTTKTEERFEALDDRLKKITAAIEGQQKLIEKQNLNSSSLDIEALQSQFSKMLAQMKLELATGSSTQDDADESETEPNWSSQKQAMLSKYGIDPEHRPDMDLPTAPDPVLETTMADEELSAATKLSPESSGSEEESVSTDPKEIKRVKDELNSKLRAAEVELSIERAKLSQLEAELESKQHELDRRDRELTQKYRSQQNNSASPGEPEDSLLDRLKKHLTAKDRKNLDRI